MNAFQRAAPALPLRQPDSARHIAQFINYDTSIATSSTGGPEPCRPRPHDVQRRRDVERHASNRGHGRRHAQRGRTCVPDFEETGENVSRSTADAVGSQVAHVRANYEFAERTGSALNQALLWRSASSRSSVTTTSRIDASSFHRQIDVTERRGHLQRVRRVRRRSVRRQPPRDAGGNGPRRDLRRSTFNSRTAGSVRARHDYERYAGFQQSRTATPGEQAADPLRDWTTDSTERVHYFSVYLRLRVSVAPRLDSRTSMPTRGATISTASCPAGRCRPAQLPEVFNKLQELRADVRHRLSNRLAATFSHLYQPFRVYDFAFDPTVINGSFSRARWSWGTCTGRILPMPPSSG